jgi:hypothetical protein
VAARGTVYKINGQPEFVSDSAHVLAAGRYLLTIVRDAHGRAVRSHESVTIT